MISHSRPTRAEASDVANAVLDGSDALMLAAETASGRYPVETVKMMNRIIGYTETKLPHRIESQYFISGVRTSEAMADGACRAAQDINAKAIVVFTHSGLTARLISKLRPMEPVIAYTPDEKTFRAMSLFWGITPQQLPGDMKEIDESFVRRVEKHLRTAAIAKKGDRIILVASSSFFGKRNIIRLHQIE
jgi:pyruvate kinase